MKLKLRRLFISPKFGRNWRPHVAPVHSSHSSSSCSYDSSSSKALSCFISSTCQPTSPIGSPCKPVVRILAANRRPVKLFDGFGMLSRTVCLVVVISSHKFASRTSPTRGPHTPLSCSSILRTLDPTRRRVRSLVALRWADYLDSNLQSHNPKPRVADAKSAWAVEETVELCLPQQHQVPSGPPSRSPPGSPSGPPSRSPSRSPVGSPFIFLSGSPSRSPSRSPPRSPFPLRKGRHQDPR